MIGAITSRAAKEELLHHVGDTAIDVIIGGPGILAVRNHAWIIDDRSWRSTFRISGVWHSRKVIR